MVAHWSQIWDGDLLDFCSWASLNYAVNENTYDNTVKGNLKYSEKALQYMELIMKWGNNRCCKMTSALSWHHPIPATCTFSLFLSFSPIVEIDEEKHRKKASGPISLSHTSQSNTRSNSRKIKGIGPHTCFSIHPMAALWVPSDKFLLAVLWLRTEPLFKIFTKLYCDDLINAQNVLYFNDSPYR